MSDYQAIMNKKVVKKKDIPSTKIGDEIGMLNLHSGKYLLANNVASKIIELLDSPSTVKDIISKLLVIYDVREQICETDVAEFIEDLARRKIIEMM